MVANRNVTKKVNRSANVNKTLNRYNKPQSTGVDNNRSKACQHSGEMNISTLSTQYVSHVTSFGDSYRGHTDTNKIEDGNTWEVLLYDVRANADDKFIHSLLFTGRYKEKNDYDSQIYQQSNICLVLFLCQTR